MHELLILSGPCLQARHALAKPAVARTRTQRQLPPVRGQRDRGGRMLGLLLLLPGLPAPDLTGVQAAWRPLGPMMCSIRLLELAAHQV